MESNNWQLGGWIDYSGIKIFWKDDVGDNAENYLWILGNMTLLRCVNGSKMKILK